MKELDLMSIESAASHELRKVGRLSFSSNGFSNEEIDAISAAISAAIESYDKQRNDDAKK